MPFPAGGTADVMPRIVADWLSRKWGQPVVIENKTGAAGNIGAEAAFNAEPDGYTLLSAPPPPLVINQNLYPKLAFDPTQFVPISVMGIVPNALVVNPQKIAATHGRGLHRLRARRNPGKISAATQGNGIDLASHLRAVSDDGGGEVPAGAVSRLGAGAAGAARRRRRHHVRQSRRLARAGEGRPAQADRGRHREAHERAARRADDRRDAAGICVRRPGSRVVAPPKTPAPIVAKISADIAEAIRQPDVRKRFDDLSAEPVGGTPAETAAFMRDEVERWNKVIKAANVKLE